MPQSTPLTLASCLKVHAFGGGGGDGFTHNHQFPQEKQAKV